MSSYLFGLQFGFGFLTAVAISVALIWLVVRAYKSGLAGKIGAIGLPKASTVIFGGVVLVAAVAAVTFVAIAQNQQCKIDYEQAWEDWEARKQLAEANLEQCKSGAEYQRYVQAEFKKTVEARAKWTGILGKQDTPEPTLEEFREKLEQENPLYPRSGPCNEQTAAAKRAREPIYSWCYSYPRWWHDLTGIRL